MKDRKRVNLPCKTYSLIPGLKTPGPSCDVHGCGQPKQFYWYMHFMSSPEISTQSVPVRAGES